MEIESMIVYSIKDTIIDSISSSIGRWGAHKGNSDLDIHLGSADSLASPTISALV